MEKSGVFAEVLEAADALSVDEQETLVEILSRRVTHLRRSELANEIKAARDEFHRDTTPAVSPGELMAELLR